VLLESEAVLIGPQSHDGGAQQLAGIFRSVVEARGARYLMLNAPEHALARICDLVPGSRSPSVLPLAEPGQGDQRRRRWRGAQNRRSVQVEERAVEHQPADRRRDVSASTARPSTTSAMPSNIGDGITGAGAATASDVVAVDGRFCVSPGYVAVMLYVPGVA